MESSPSKPAALGGTRYHRGKSIPGDLTWCLLRTTDFFLHLYILKSYATITSGTSFFSLTRYYATISIMIGINSLRQIFWKLYVGEQGYEPSFAVLVAVFNAVNNGLNILMSLWSFSSQASKTDTSIFSSPVLILGLLLFVVGSVIETVCELPRKVFKSNPVNKGKLYTVGFFAYARHINFGAYLLWMVGLATFCGGLGWGVLVMLYFLYYFGCTAVPDIDRHMSAKYGKAWVEYKGKVWYAILPWISCEVMKPRGITIQEEHENWRFKRHCRFGI